jgi:hypothetical protein
VQKLRDICKVMHQINGLTKGGDEDTSRGILIPIKLIIE